MPTPLRVAGVLVALLLLGAVAYPYVAELTAPATGSRLEDWTCADHSQVDAVSFCVTLPPPSPQDKVAWNIGREVTAAKIALMAQIKGIALEQVPMTSGDLWVESKVGADIRRLLAETLEADLGSLRRDFGRPFDVRPKIVTFATAASFEEGMMTLFDYPPQVARALAASNGGALVIPIRSIAINWHALGAEKPLTILRHELAHAMIREITGPAAQMPAWFDEGLATMEQSSWDLKEDGRYTAAALVRGGRTSLSQLAGANDWIRASGAFAGRNYQLAAASIDQMKTELGLAGLARILEQLGRGVDFETAYTAASGKSLAAFTRAVPDAITRAAPTKVVTETVSTGEVKWVLKGAIPGQKANVTVQGRDVSYLLSFDVMPDENGFYTSTFGSTAPAGTYFVQAVAGDAEVSAIATVRKP